MLNREELLLGAEELLKPWIGTRTQPEPNRLDFYISREDLLGAAESLLSRGHGYLAAITGLDVPGADGADGEVEVLYSFCEGDVVVTLRVKVPYADAVLPTLCGLMPSATLYERELIEMFGVQVEGTPDTSRLLLPDDWPDGVYPLRKSFTVLSPSQTALEKS